MAIKPHITLAHDIWRSHVKPDDIVIDATCGNGHDTLVLAQLVSQGHVYAIDNQEIALEKTRKRLADYSNVSFILGCHSVLPDINPSLIVYNLGYLPGGDKEKTTFAATTLKSLKNAFNQLRAEGLLSVTLYPGHPAGNQEAQAVLEWAESLDEANLKLYEPSTRETAPKLLLIGKDLLL